MSGFPNLPSRASFGPNMQNVRPVRVPETDLSADQVNLTFWQAQGASRTVPSAVIIVDGATPVVTYQGLTFDPELKLDFITLVKNATGSYTLTFDSTYVDQKGNNVSFTPKAAMAHMQNGPLNGTIQVGVSGLDVQVVTYDSSIVATDTTFVLLVWGA